ncbi:MAG TPA: glycosyltransferase family 4 protein [Candidatus Cybelea sp.]|jgi:colanic acid biosynthesis glycosyl transferase WcaI|nr:glycosyltransferase family 4 protein [Candidatus Cybelea sp.]
MRIAVLNQTFYPDVVASGQHLADLAAHLAARGHEVTVVTSQRAYDNPGTIFPKHEVWQGVRILRVFASGFGKRAKWRRACDFATFLLSCCWRLCWLPRPDLVIAMTSPPLVSFIGAWFARLRGAQFCYWIMDLNPDEAVAAGWLNADSFLARLLEKFSRFSLRSASSIVVLDHFMRQRILDKNIEAQKISIIPPWSNDSDVQYDAQGRERFRQSHGMDGKFVVMYSGNHSPCHPLDTVLGAAKNMAENTEVVFLFVGGGSEFAKVKKFALEHALSNIRSLPYQPLSQLGGALSAADLHLVVMGDPFVGLVHPCKIYNILRIGCPLLYIGPQPSHITEIIRQVNGRLPCGAAEHGQVEQVVRQVMEMKHSISRRNGENAASYADQYSKSVLLPQLVSRLESTMDS